MIKLLFKYFILFTLLQTSLFSQTININKIVHNAYASDKKVLLYLHRIGCAYCNSMQEFTLDDEDVAEYLSKNYKIIHVNVSLDDKIIYNGKTTGGNCFAKDIGYAFYPSSLFLDKDAKIEYASVGYKNEFEFLVILQYINEGHHKKTTLQEYKKRINFTKNLDDEIKDTRKHDR